MRFGSVPPRNWQKAHGTMISHEKSTNDISNIVNVIYDSILALSYLYPVYLKITLISLFVMIKLVKMSKNLEIN